MLTVSRGVAKKSWLPVARLFRKAYVPKFWVSIRFFRVVTRTALSLQWFLNLTRGPKLVYDIFRPGRIPLAVGIDVCGGRHQPLPKIARGFSFER